ncbi:MAG: tRNA preQ1(34) S-adenosylmethionine ribosyltransferase-isomerase QueA [Pseudomonadales bacterium]
MQRQDFQYSLPAELIARLPLPERSASRLLHLPYGDGLHHRQFRDLPDLLQPGDVLVLNDTRVLKARLRGEKDSGGRAEVLVERLVDAHAALCQVRVSKPLKAGRRLRFGQASAETVSREGEFYRLRFDAPVLDVLEREGEVPLPPYVQRAADAEDDRRYQTVFAERPGAVAAPTAGLHFDTALLAAIEARGIAIARVTLHVGAGTFQPVRVDDLAQHRMHAEWYNLPAASAGLINARRAAGGRVVAVGTTVVRTLESVADDAGLLTAMEGDTRLFITPGYRFRCVDALVTNFHLPETTLLMLVCAFAGHARVMAAYEEAVDRRYRFFSYGDAMFLERAGKSRAGSGPEVPDV